MKRKIAGLLSVLILVFVGTVIFAPRTNAYLTKDCFAIQYKYVTSSNVGKDASAGAQGWEIHTTEKVCVNAKGLLFKGKTPVNAKKVVNYPKLTISKDKKSLTVIYCNKNPVSKCSSKKSSSKTFKYSSNEGISGLGNKVQNSLPSKTAVYYSILPLGNSQDAQNQTAGEAVNTTSGDPIAVANNGGEDSASAKNIIYKCGNAGGADALGWILCPAMTLAGEGTEYIYNAFVEPSLRIEPKLFTSGDGGVEGAWGTFRDIANVLFVILFLVVIISQLTGVGIDNYGIKKILPKLVVAAILINLSYILCIVLVDVSNILGNSLQALFDGMGSNLDPTVTVNDAYDATGENPIDRYGIDSTGGSLTVIGIITIFVTMTGAIWATPGILLSSVIGIIGIAVGIFFLFVLLAARQAVVVILVVLSPLAVVCYMLPNTKKLFEKWENTFKTMLLLYPICGLLVGGGNYVSSLLLTVGLGDGFFTAITAMLAGIIPIFFIPSITKQAFSSLGTVGSKIAGFGDRMKSRAQGAAANSRTYKNLQESAARFATRKRAEMGENAYNARGPIGSLRRAMLGGNRGMARTMQQHAKNQAEDTEAAVTLQNQRYGNESIDELMNRWNSARTNGKVNAQGVNEELDALTRVISRRFGARGANSIANAVSGIGADDQTYDSMVKTLRKTMDEDSTFNNTVTNKTPDLADMLSNNGYIDRDNRASLGAFSARLGSDQSIASSDVDLANMTGGTFRRGLQNGAFDVDRLERLANSDNKDVAAAFQNDPGKSDDLLGNLYNMQNQTDHDIHEAARFYREEQRRKAEAAQEQRKVQMDNMEQTLNSINEELKKQNQQNP